MFKVRLSALALAGVCVSWAAQAATITEDFATDPVQKGWQVFGNANLFQWDAANHQLAVTWDSTQPNSYFFHPLEGYLTRYDDFSFEFDLNLSDAAGGVEPDTTGALQLGIGFLNLTGATNSSFMRGSYGGAPNVAEFNYYPWGYFVDSGTTYDSPAAVVPSFISGTTSTHYAPAFVAPYSEELPTGVTLHVLMSFTASNQTATLSVTTNGIALASLPPLVLDNYFVQADDFHVDAFSISSYSSTGAWASSLLAHGRLANVRVSLPPPAENLRVDLASGLPQVQFCNRTNWVYTLERTANFASWSEASLPVAGNGGVLVLQDTNGPADQAFYRVRAQRP